MKWVLIILTLQSETSWLPAKTENRFVFDTKAECQEALQSGTFVLSPREVGKSGGMALNVFCAPEQIEAS